MNKSKLFIYVLLLILLQTCTKDDSDLSISYFDTPIISGYYERNIAGQIIRKIGIPNVKLGNTSNDINSEYFFVVFPNPCYEHCQIYVKSPESNDDKQLWITHAYYENEDDDNNSVNIGMNNLILGGYPLIHNNFTFDNYVLDLTSLNEGYYRIYLKIGGHLLYDNLVIYNPYK